MRRGKSRGFTIVELLIVIVVIAILAAITIVAYNGIQERARASAVSSALNQANKKIAVWQVDNPGQYPADLAAAGITNTDSVSFQYTVDNSTNPPTYCVTATTGSTSYKASSTTTTPVSGGCPGHSQGGVAAITNLAINPSVETNTTSWSATFGTGGTGSTARVSGAGQSGSNYYRITWTTAPTSMTSGGIWPASNATTPGAAGKTYTASGYLRSSWSGGIFNLNLVPYSSSWTYTGGEVYGSQITMPANTWTRFTATITAPASTENMTIRLRAAGGTLPGANATLDADAFMLTEGSTAPNYADGSSANWAWNGTTNNSTSTGPAL